MIEILSIDLSNYCSKGCYFCYNHSNKLGITAWQPQEVIDFASDCIVNGIKAISLGGGEPFEYEGIFSIIKALYPKCYISITSNGIPLEKETIWENLKQNKPDKIHLTIHFPQDETEVSRILNRLNCIAHIGITPGVNLLVGADNITHCQNVYRQLLSQLNPQQIILVPQRFSNTPSPKQLAFISDGNPFQSTSCLLQCQKPTNFVSISWDKKVNFCSYAEGKEPLIDLTYNGLSEALNRVNFHSCNTPYNK